MIPEPADVVVVGMGVGGEEVASRLLGHGLDVVGVEQGLVGGECPYWGCIPSKMMVRAGNLLAEARRVDKVAGEASVTPDWDLVARRIRDEATDDWDDTLAVERFERAGGRFHRATARLVGPRRVEIDGTTVEARRGVVLATGSRPAIPPIPGLGDVAFWTNREAIATTEVPASLAVLGGGAIGLELGQVFARFGAAVTIVEAVPRLLPAEEPEAGELVARLLRAEGIHVRSSTRVESVGILGNRVILYLDDGRRVEADQLLVATGRDANLDGLGLESVGLDADLRSLPVDEHLRAGDGLWAIGDITGVGAFTHVAVYQARKAAADILGVEHEPAQYHALPRVTFTDPEVASVGFAEATARARGLNVSVGYANVSTTARGWLHGVGNEGFIKLVADADHGILVGATAVGPTGGEVLAMPALAVQARVPVATLREMIYAYPTFHRGVEDALRDLGTTPS